MLKKILVSLLVISNFCFAQQKPKPEFLKINGKKTDLVSVGKTNLYACQFEVTNYDWLCFLNWIRKTKGEDEYLKNLPDTLVWRSHLSYREQFAQYYLRHPAYRDYPVVGVNWLQANDFCAWRTDRVNEFILIREGLRLIFF
jgi:formylglycine-generating enzyme required for sulfatase activity